MLGVDGEIVVKRRRQCTPEEKAALMAEVEPRAVRFRLLPSSRTIREFGINPTH
jgi:transposase-like protein